MIAWPAFGLENPYNRMLYEEMRRLGVPVSEFSPGRLFVSPAEVVHLHWPELVLYTRSWPLAALRAVSLLALLALARLRGSRIVWTVHNLHSHDRLHPRLERWFWPAFLPLLSGYIALSAGGQEAARRRFIALQRRPGFVVPSGHFRGIYPDTISDARARASLGISPEAEVYGFFGLIRPYKNVPHLIQTFRSLPDAGARLLITGRPDSPATREEVIEAAGGDDRVLLTLEHIPDDQVQVYLRASDLVVLPFTDVLNSGSALLALAFDRPVLVPFLGAMGELQATAGGEWVRTYAGPLCEEDLRGALPWARASRGRCEPSGLPGWGLVARQTLDVYEALVAGGRG